MHSIFVTVNVHSEHVEAFIAAGDGDARASQRFTEITKMRVEFRGSTGQVHSADAVLLAPGQDAVHGFLSHQLRAFGSGIDMTMGAGLIAQIPKIQLQVHGIASAKGR